jgi:predicted enzyme related to lactoylglutathione lyase
MDILINIDVPDLEAGTAFYLAAFDLTVGRRFGSDVIELLGAAAPIYLLAKPAGTAATLAGVARRSYGRHWTPVHLDIAVPDIEAALRRAAAAGAVKEAPVRTAAWGKLALMADPFGNGFCLVQFLGRGYDEIAEPRIMLGC